MYLSRTFTVTGSGVSATGSLYGLIRLQTDVIDYAPELVIIDFAVNDTDTASVKAAAEALIRRLRIALPNAKLVCVFFIEVADPGGVDTTNLREAVKQNWITLCNLYSIPYADYAAEVQRAVGAAEYTLAYVMGDTIHPNTMGHSIAAGMLENTIPTLFVGPQVSGDLPARVFDNGDYENDPIIRYGIDNDGETGTGWVTDGNDRISSTPDDTITYTGTFQAIIRDFKIGAGQGVVATKVDAENWFNVDLSADASNYRTHWLGARGVHTVVYKVISGNIEFRRFLAV